MQESKSRRTELTRELVQRMTHSRHFNKRTCTYNPPRRAVPKRVKKLLQELEKKKKALGIFCAFIPKRVEQLVWQHQLTEEKRKELERRGITPIPVPDGDVDHA